MDEADSLCSVRTWALKCRRKRSEKSCQLKIYRFDGPDYEKWHSLSIYFVLKRQNGLILHISMDCFAEKILFSLLFVRRESISFLNSFNYCITDGNCRYCRSAYSEFYFLIIIYSRVIIIKWKRCLLFNRLTTRECSRES